MAATARARSVVVAGATGFIGKAVVRRLEAGRWSVVIVSRDPDRARRLFPNAIACIDYDGHALEHAVVEHGHVIRLAGENPLSRRWTQSFKESMWTSRVNTAVRIARALAQSRADRRVLISAGGINIHPDSGEDIVTEESPFGDGWVARMLAAKEAALETAAREGARIVTLRIGIVLGAEGGPLEFIDRPFRMRVGGRIGSGRQFVPWLHLDDMAEMFVAALENDSWRGPFIAAAPNPVRAGDLAVGIARRLGRASWCHVPTWIARFAMGEVATLVVSSYRASPTKAQMVGFRFQYPDVDRALDTIYAARA